MAVNFYPSQKMKQVWVCGKMKTKNVFIHFKFAQELFEK